MAAVEQAVGLQAVGLPPSEELLAYYRSRLQSFDKEREDAIRLLDTCSPSQKEFRQLETERDKRTVEVRQLQKALSDAHAYLFDERARLLAIQAENDRLRLQEMEDRKKIQRLLALTQPVSEEVTYLRDQPPDTLTRLPRPGAFAGPSGSAPRGESHGQPGSQARERVLKTVYLPTEKTDTLMLQVESLQAQLSELKEFMNERIEALLQDRRIREEDFAATSANADLQLQEVRSKLAEKEDLLRGITRDMLLFRHKSNVAQRKTEEAHASREQAEAERSEAEQAFELCLEVLPPEVAEILRKLRPAIRAKVALELERSQRGGKSADKDAELEKSLREACQVIDGIHKSATKVAQGREEAAKAKLQECVKGQKHEILALEKMHEAVKSRHENRIAQLEERLAKLREQYKRLEYRRVLDVEGFTSEITILRKQLQSVVRKLRQVLTESRRNQDGPLSERNANRGVGIRAHRLQIILEDLLATKAKWGTTMGKLSGS